MFDPDNIYFHENIPQSVKDECYDELVSMLSDMDGIEDKIIYITLASAFNIINQLFFQIYILDSYKEKNSLESKENFLYFINHA